MTRKRSRGPSQTSSGEDDGHELWNIIKSRIEPLRGRRDRVQPGSTLRSREVVPPGVTREKQTQPTVVQPPVSRAPLPPPPPVASGMAAQPAIERKKVRWIASGKLPIDAVLDLHGMRQDEARTALHRFLHQAQSRRLKFVTVITGKGVAGSPKERSDQWGEPEPGVLRRQVPRWLAEPALRPLIVGTSQAGPRHGGSGALYIELRRSETKLR